MCFMGLSLMITTIYVRSKFVNFVCGWWIIRKIVTSTISTFSLFHTNNKSRHIYYLTTGILTTIESMRSPVEIGIPMWSLLIQIQWFGLYHPYRTMGVEHISPNQECTLRKYSDWGCIKVEQELAFLFLDIPT